MSVVGHGASQALRLGSNLLLTHLLYPEAFGIMALVNLLLQGLQMISDVGIIPSIIQSPRGDERDFLDTAFTIQAIRGAALFVIGLAAAYPFSLAYEEPILLQLVPVAAASALFQGLEATKLATAQRHLQLGRIVFVDIASQVVSIVTMGVLAYLTRSVWALLIGSVGASFVRMLLSHVIFPGPRNRFRFEAAAVSEIYAFGIWVFLSTLVTYFAMRFDVMLLGKLIPLELLGVYGISVMISQVPMLLAGQVSGSVAFPAFASSLREGRDVLERNFLRARAVVLPVGMFIVMGGVLVAPPFFHFLYDERYADCAWMTQLLMLGVWFFFLQDFPARALLALGEPRALALGNFAKLLFAVPLSIAGHHVLGVPGFILGAALGSVLHYLVIVLQIRRHQIHLLVADLPYSAITVGLGVVGTWVPHAVPSVEPAVTSLAIAALLLPFLAFRALRAIRGAMRG